VGRILGLDVGERRIGLAISTPEGRLAVPLRVLERQDEAADLEAIAALARAEQVDTLVIGHPLSMDGTAGAQARRVEAFARALAKVAGLPFELWDERLSSVQAERSVRLAHGRRRVPSDDVAAAIILQGYLDRRRA
jgi:putative Holliday junction resolvase